MSHMDSDQYNGYARAMADVADERHRQHEQWGQQNLPDGTGPGEFWPAVFVLPMDQAAEIARAQVNVDADRGLSTYAAILLEEVFEALATDDVAALRAELVQVAAVAVQWIEAIDRRNP